MPGRYLGLDLGAFTIKGVEVAEKKKEITLSNAYILPSVPELFMEGLIGDFAEASEQVLSLIESGGFVKKKVALSIKGESTRTRMARVPFTDKNRLQRDLMFIAEQYMQVDLESYSVDYDIIQTDAAIAQARIAFAAAPKDALSDYDSIIKSSNLEVGIIDMESYALCNLYEALQYPASDTSLILHTGHTSNLIIFIDYGKFSYQEASIFGGKHANSLLANMANLPDDDTINTLKADPNRSSEAANITNILTTHYMNDLYGDIEKIVSKYTLLGGKMPVRGYLSGGAVSLVGLKERLEAEMKIKFSIMNPADKLKIESSVALQLLETRPAVLNVAIGLALRDE
ncbi:MAG: pilus assembly protein PilM [Deferribacteraceae bacterium]|jgi:type IV pilus assembly protein PilM|nr:pilus assembly protein PilM [Deferribacteraceae bacterium]